MAQEISKFESVMFTLTLGLIVLVAIPYGAVEKWWEAAFIVAVLILFNAWLIRDFLIGGKKISRGAHRALLLPLAGLALFAFVQSLRIFPHGETFKGIETAYRSISADPPASRFIAFKLIAFILFIELILRFTTSLRSLKILLALILATASGSALFGISRDLFFAEQSAVIFPVLESGVGFAQFINRNHFALMMLMAAGAAFGLAFGRIGFGKKTFYLAVALLLICSIVLTTSRGGILAFFAELGVLLYLHRRYCSDSATPTPPSAGRNWKSAVRVSGKTPQILKQTAIGVLIVLFSIIGILWVGDEKLAVRFEKGWEEKSSASADENGERRFPERTNIWKASVNLIADYPLAGVGFGGYKNVIPEYFQGAGVYQLEEAHNDYLELAASGGIIGLFLAGWFAVKLFQTARKNLRVSFSSQSPDLLALRCGAIGGITGLIVHSVGDFGLHILINLVIFAVLTAVLIVDFDQNKNERNLIRK